MGDKYDVRIKQTYCNHALLPVVFAIIYKDYQKAGKNAGGTVEIETVFGAI